MEGFLLASLYLPPLLREESNKKFSESRSKEFPTSRIEMYGGGRGGLTHFFSTIRRLLTAIKTRHLPLWFQNFSVFIPLAVFHDFEILSLMFAL